MYGAIAWDLGQRFLYLFFVQWLAYVVRRSETEMDVLGAL